jgi:hypothetical protein
MNAHTRPASCGRIASRAAVAIAFSVVVLTSCAGADGPIEGATCVDDAECSDGVLCRLGVCASTDDLGRVHIEVRPSSSSGLLTQQFMNERPEADTRLELTLSPTLDVAGVISLEDGTAVLARVVAVPEGPIPGRAIVASTTSGMTGAFTLPVVERVRHNLTIYPDDVTAPPFFSSSALIATQGMSAAREITLPLTENLVHVSGRVVAGGGASALGIPGLQVHVAETSGRRVSSVALTDDDGAFTLALSETRTGPFVLEVRPGEQQPYVPVVRLDFEDTSSDLELLEPIDLGDLGTPVPVSGRVVGPDGGKVPAAVIYLRGLVGNGEVRRQIACDENGLFDADLAPGIYDVAVVAPLSTSPAGMLVLSESATVAIPTEGDLLFTLPSRPQFGGSVVLSSRDPASGALVHLARIGAEGGGAEPVLEGATLTTTVTTASDGAFSVPLDPGRYRVRIDPTVESQAPSTTLVIDVFASPEPALFTLPPARFAAGIAKDGTGSPVADAQVRVFATVVGEDGGAIALGEGTTDLEGLFTVTVPDFTSVASE